MDAPIVTIFTIVAAVATVLGVVTGVWFLVDKWRGRRGKTSLWFRLHPHSLTERLLLYVWSYPEGPGSQGSWAVKESEVLRGRLDSAREQPGLGIAILSTELALDVFGARGYDKVQSSIRWAIDRVDPHPPHFLPGVLQDSVVSRLTSTPDFRHTLALAIVLARSKAFYGYLDCYVQIVLDVQQKDGGWDPGGGRTVSEVFTVFYAVELLHLCARDQHFASNARRQFELSRDRGLAWLIAHRTPAGLWKSEVLTAFGWDDLLTTAWVLHRLSPICSTIVVDWESCVERALIILIQRSMDASSWTRSSPDERNRVEARIGASVARAAANRKFMKSTIDLVDVYMRDWRRRAANWAAALPEADVDLATAIFLLGGLYGHGELVDHANGILASSDPGE